MKNKHFVLIGVVAFALFIRLIFLNRFPIGMSHDELNYIIAAKSLFWAHLFPPGTAPAVLPISMSNFTVIIAEVPALILAPLIGIFSSSLFISRVLGAILSVSTVLAVYFIAFHITKKRSVALICALLMSINPWSFLMGRTIFEVNFFVAFFLWGFLVLLKSKGWKIFCALSLFLLGFFSYTGGQLGFFLFIVVTLAYHYFISKDDRKNLKIYIIFFCLISLVLVGYILTTTRNQTFQARSSELYLPNQQAISETVDQERKLAIASPFNSLFINKATVYFGGFINKYLNTFSMNTLFLTGETRAAFSYQTHGTFYLIDFLFIIVGLSSLFVINKKSWILFVSIIICCSVTSGLNVVENSYSQRVGLIYPFLVMLSGIGVGTVISAAKSKKVQIILALGIAVIYLISLVNLMFIYFVRFPVYASDGWFFQDRVLSNYLIRSEETYPNTKILIYTSEPKIIFEEYLFYNNIYTGENVLSINEHLNQKDYSINNLVFTDECPIEGPDKNSVIIFDGSFICNKLSTLSNLVRITRLKDVLANYLVYNDKLCNYINLNRYVPQSAYDNFSVEKQSPKDFCLNWLTKIEQ